MSGYLGQVSLASGGTGGYLGEVSLVGGVPAGEITGLNPDEILYGSSVGKLEQDPLFVWKTVTNLLGIGTSAPTKTVDIRQLASTSGTPTGAAGVVGGAHTSITASTEVIDVDVDLSRTLQHLQGNYALQRSVVFRPPTFSFTGILSTITTAATVAITGAPVVGANGAITNRLAFLIEGGGFHSAGAGGSSFVGGIGAAAAGLNGSAVGVNAVASGTNTTAFGSFSTASATNATAFGSIATASATDSLAFGRNAVASHTGSTCIGTNVASTAANQLVIGTDVRDCYLGKGVTNATPQAITIQPTGAIGADQAGVDHVVAGGKSTGAGAGGGVAFATSPAGGAGSALNALVENARITSRGNFCLGTTAAGTTAQKVIALHNSATEPTTSANLAQLYSVDVAGSAVLCIFQETAPIADVGLVSTHSGLIRWNGATYKVPLVLVP